MKVGDVYYDAYYDEEAKKVDVTEYRLRTIRGAWGYIVQIESFTWGKRSGKTGDYGWLDPIPSWCRTKFLVRNGVPKKFSRSKTQALRVLLASEKENVAEGFGEEYSEQLIKTLTARIKADMSRRKKAKEAAPSRAKILNA